MSIQKKIMLMLLCFSIIPVFIISVTLLLTNIRTIESLHENRLNAIARTSAAAFNEIVDLRKKEVSLLASNWNILDYIRAVRQNDTDTITAASAAVDAYFHSYLDSMNTLDDLVFLDETGKVTIAFHSDALGLDLSDMDYFQRLHENKSPDYVLNSKVHTSLLYPDDADRRYLALSKAFWDANGQLEGALVAYVDANALADFSRSISFGETGLAFVIDSDNYILYHADPRFYNSYTSAPRLDRLIHRWSDREIPASGLIDDVMDGTRRIYYYEIMDEIDMALILRQDYSEFSKDRNIAMLLAVIFVAATILLALFFSRWFSKKFMHPILKLKNAFASGINEGSYVRCEILSNDEFGDMSKSYNMMIGHLEHQHQLIITEKNKNEYNASHEKITGLYNRAAFEQIVSERISNETPFGIFFVDLNNFKQINDVFGHPFGDAVLQTFSQKLLSSLCAFDVCAHTGSDEFILLKDGSYELMKTTAIQLIDEQGEPLIVDNTNLFISISMGIAFFPDNGLSVSNLITNADIAMYQAKEKGKNFFCLYNREMRDNLDRHNQIVYILRHCIEKQELFFMYQPIFSCADNQIKGFEALMRIHSESLGLLSPVEFIPIAETDRAVSISLYLWSLRQACKFIKRLQTECSFDGYIAVNISTMQLANDNFVNDVIATVESEEINPGCLRLDIAESSVPIVLENHIQKLAALCEYGVETTLDDFGTHYSWFHYLAHLPLSTIKIDRKLFTDIALNPDVEILSRSMIELAHKFGLTTVAEGIEQQADYDMLVSLGLDMAQGFLLSKPTMADRTIALLLNEQSEND